MQGIGVPITNMQPIPNNARVNGITYTPWGMYPFKNNKNLNKQDICTIFESNIIKFSHASRRKCLQNNKKFVFCDASAKGTQL